MYNNNNKFIILRCLFIYINLLDLYLARVGPNMFLIMIYKMFIV